ncbi:hypothetical protein Tsubulata_050737 [Turnera subulata]|uniref:NADH-ubiquinone oxidoreductase chain 3 n=2 Tax=Magnoliopsida TaxID=3398 RepID=A0A9Q0JFN7_9ROSI|nr:hypothetical protein Tsubulata_050737 [Turnera subulata]
MIILSPISKGAEKLSSYESGIEPMGDAWLQFRIRYYLFALVFVVFDVETVFLYPWAMSVDLLGISLSVLERARPISVISTTSNDLSNWSRLSSLWPLLYGTSCCFIEFASLIGSRFDFDRYGLVPRSSARQADLILTAGTVTMKMAPSLVRLYEQMPEPKYVIAMGACTITGGMFSTDSYSTVRESIS